ncbi:single strand DNA binding protein [Bacillus phage G]|uniref:Gp377 n=1 Tax=Bacillus phage G TaxID=2884420 RepID=G3MAB8_9CAUD|nr:single strand DNA binding protein [Bacillus phage G]AEO93636.1 gp377 [Bacillus phage G]
MSELDWGSVRAGGSGEGTPFIKLQPGVNQVRVVGKPYLVDIHWEKGLDGQNKKVVCPGAGCPVCKAGHVPMARYQVLVIDRTDNKVKILEGGPRIFSAIKDYAMDPDYGDPSKYDLKIKKEGSGRETKYTVLASPNKGNLTPEESDLVDNSKSLTDINKPKSIDEIYQMGLEVLASSMPDLADDAGWGPAPTGGDSTGSSDMGISDDDWNDL